MSGYDVAALATLAACLLASVRAVRWAGKSHPATVDVSQLDRWDFEHRPY